MREHGGFEHNLQSLRVVDQLEARYPRFDGLNLTLGDTLRHSQALFAPPRPAPDGCRARRAGPAFPDGTQPSLEAQVVNLADELAYNAHDIDDGVRSGLITLEQLDAVPLFAHWHEQVLQDHPQLAAQPGRRALFETLRRMLSAQIGDLVSATDAAVQPAAPADADAVATCPPLAMLSPDVRERFTELKRFLLAELYRHPQVMQMTSLGRTVVAELFQAYRDAPHEMPADYAAAPTAARGGRLHRRHDRPLCPARTPPPHRAAAVRA
jgi:dGTPase